MTDQHKSIRDEIVTCSMCGALPCDQSNTGASVHAALEDAKRHVDAICIGLASPIHGEDPYGWIERAEAAQRCLADILHHHQSEPVVPPAAAVEIVLWQRLHPHNGWVEVNEEDMDFYRGMGQPMRPLYASPPPSAAPMDDNTLWSVVDKDGFIIASGVGRSVTHPAAPTGNTDIARLWNETANSDEFCKRLGVTPIRDTATGDAVMWRDNEGDYSNFTHVIEAFAAPTDNTAQCCMCGRKDLSTAEGDGGPECQLPDDRWTCSQACWDKATSAPTDNTALVEALRAGWHRPEGIHHTVTLEHAYTPHGKRYEAWGGGGWNFDGGHNVVNGDRSLEAAKRACEEHYLAALASHESTLSQPAAPQPTPAAVTTPPTDNTALAEAWKAGRDAAVDVILDPEKSWLNSGYGRSMAKRAANDIRRIEPPAALASLDAAPAEGDCPTCAKNAEYLRGKFRDGGDA